MRLLVPIIATVLTCLVLAALAAVLRLVFQWSMWAGFGACLAVIALSFAWAIWLDIRHPLPRRRR